MAWYDEDSWLTAAFAPRLSTVAVALTLTLLLPVLLHLFIYRRATPTTLPSLLLLGPSGAGKTALLTLVRLSPARSIGVY
jgi:signal recognition particle receptor subunit beta